jgi:hypothetical protein
VVNAKPKEGIAKDVLLSLVSLDGREKRATFQPDSEQRGIYGKRKIVGQVKG